MESLGPYQSADQTICHSAEGPKADCHLIGVGVNKYIGLFTGRSSADGVEINGSSVYLH